MVKKGERVGAISSADEKGCRFFGYGIYEGDFVPPKTIGLSGRAGIPNPRIKLDNGKTVYGCECWWGGEEAIKKKIAAYPKVVMVDIEKEREDG